MAVVLLHLVNEHGQPVPPSVRVAVETAYHWVLREYEHFDQALLAGMAESVGSAMCRRLVHIEFPRRYAIVALTGKLQEWYLFTVIVGGTFALIVRVLKKVLRSVA